MSRPFANVYGISASLEYPPTFYRLASIGGFSRILIQMDMPSKLLTPGIIFLLTLVSGLWLSRTGKPLNTVVFTIHKLIALATVILTGMAIYNLINDTQIQLLIAALIAVAALCVVALFITGALMSRDKPLDDNLLTIHKAAPFLVVIAMLVTLYISAGNKL
jgi:hypothetical protein